MGTLRSVSTPWPGLGRDTAFLAREMQRIRAREHASNPYIALRDQPLEPMERVRPGWHWCETCPHNRHVKTHTADAHLLAGILAPHIANDDFDRDLHLVLDALETKQMLSRADPFEWEDWRMEYARSDTGRTAGGW